MKTKGNLQQSWFQITAFLILWSALTGACVPTQQPMAAASHLENPEGLTLLTAADLAGSHWILERYGPTDEPTLALPEPAVSLLFEPDRKLRGMAGCNTYAAQFELDGYRLAHAGIIQTPFGCPDEESWAQETLFLQAMGAAQSMGLKQDRLAINYEGGQLLFAKHPLELSNILEGTAWSLIYFQTETGNQPIIPGSQITAEFGRSSITGTAGCNGYTSAYETLDQAFTMWQVVMTAEACSPEGIMSQEAAYMAALHEAHFFAISDNILTINHDGGALRFGRLQPVTESRLSGTAWQLSTTTIADFDQPTAPDIPIIIRFDEQKIYGSAGCNQFEARYDESPANTIHIRQLGATQSACAPSLMRQESDFLRLFRQVELVEMSDTGRQLKLSTHQAELLFVPPSAAPTATSRLLAPGATVSEGSQAMAWIQPPLLDRAEIAPKDWFSLES